MNKENDSSIAIVITTINAPTEAVKKFAQFGWATYCVGDLKTKTPWSLASVEYIGVGHAKERKLKALERLIGYNTYVRKNLGYIEAARGGSDFIFETDDDNIPYKTTRRQVAAVAQGEWRTTQLAKSQERWVNVYRAYTQRDIWPRGLALDCARKAPEIVEVKGTCVGVNQFLADGDPDVDAIYRLMNPAGVKFRRLGRSLGVPAGAMCPFNSQATLWPRKFYPLMFLPIGCTDRVTDILRGLLVQIVLGRIGEVVAFSDACVYQVRNAHNLVRDFEQEVALHTSVRRLVESISDSSLPKDPVSAYRILLDLAAREKIISADSLRAFDLFVALLDESK